jgi:hypothetical protein
MYVREWIAKLAKNAEAAAAKMAASRFKDRAVLSGPSDGGKLKSVDRLSSD